MTDTPTIRSCPQCEQQLPPDAPEGLCPECLMLGGLETMSMPEGYTPSGALPDPGDTFGGYKIERELGRGGMGAVFEAEQIETGRRVALKLLNHQLDSPEARARFLREGRLAASVNHPNSVYVFGTEEIGDMPAIAMEMVGGGTLEEYVKENGPLPIGEAIDAILQIISGLEAAQEIGILHRDVKPGNCFRDTDGTVKVGDFGLSISTDARDEHHLTMEGTIFGTPAFASPEQLRGDELNVRSDIYAVGATLFYLLTGRPAFTGKSVAQLFANVLEGKTPSPKKFRPEMPTVLANAVMRCLEKIPTNRYRAYSELRKALFPFGSDAPVAASLPLRVAAMAVDVGIFMLVSMPAQSLFMGDLYSTDEHVGPGLGLTAILIGFSLWFLYFSLMEGLLGYTLGKRICRLQVVRTMGGLPGFPVAVVRASIAILIPALPSWIFSSMNPSLFARGLSDPMSFLIMMSSYIIVGIFFLTARKRNGLASVFDLISKTRVIRSKVYGGRPVSQSEVSDPVTASEETPKIGPYHVLDVLGKSEEAEWVVGYDTRLLRKIWIRKVPIGTEPVSSDFRQLGRTGRLRWLAGRRSEEESWDAYEFPGGQSLSRLLKNESLSWSRVRYWLLDLAKEFRIAEEEGNQPEVLSLQRVWITASGRAKLLDFPAPGNSLEESETTQNSPTELLEEVAALAKAPIPLHAVSFRENLALYPNPSSLIDALKQLVHRVTSVSRIRRVFLVVGCIAFPILAFLMMLFAMPVLKQWQNQQPEIMEMNLVLSFWEMSGPDGKHPQKNLNDELFEIYIASHYRDTINDPKQWNSSLATSLFSGEKRALAEESLHKHPSPTTEQIDKANEAIGGFTKQATETQMAPSFALMAGVASLLLYVGAPAIIASVFFRGGLLMLASGVVVAKTDGSRASRGRCFWRSLVTWSPWLIAIALILVPLIPVKFDTIVEGTIWITAALGIVSLCLPGRSLQDRIAGTCLVPR